MRLGFTKGSRAMQTQKNMLPRAVRIYSLAFVILLLAFLVSFSITKDFSFGKFDSTYRARRDLVALYSNLRMKLGDRVFNKAVVGGDGWIFYTGEQSIPDYQNTTPFSQERLQQLQQALDRLNAELTGQGKTLLVVVAPNKSSIYSQFMPAQIPVLGETSRLDQFLNYMRQHGQTRVLDLRPTLIEASQSGDVYYKVDTHWNDMGAYYAYRGILNALSDPRLQPHPLSDYDIVPQHDLKVPDLPMVLGVPQYEEVHQALVLKKPVQVTEISAIPLPNDRQVLITTSSDGLPSLLIYHDSFYITYDSLSHLMQPHFSRLTAIPFVLKPGIWSLDWIQKENPDIVVIEVVERYLDTTLPRLLNLDH